jgi:hypothetical protein
MLSLSVNLSLEQNMHLFLQRALYKINLNLKCHDHVHDYYITGED